MTVRMPDTYASDVITLAAGITSSALSLTLSSAFAFMASYTGGQFAIEIHDAATTNTNSEWILIDSISSLVLTVNASGRGYAGTTAHAHATGDPVTLVALEEDLVRLWDGRNVAPAQVKVNADWGLDGTAIISPAQIVANTDNYAPTGIATASVLRLSTDASRNLTGILAPSPAYARRLVIENIGSFDLVLKDDVTSTAANRFQLAADLTLPASTHCELLYDVTLARWMLIGGTGSSGMTNPMTTQDDLIVGGASGVPARLAKGSDSQVLTVDPTTHHLVWATPGSGSSPLTTKGDLWGYDTADNRIPVGTNGQVLTADSTQALGLKWATATGGSGSISRGAYASRPAASTAGALYLATDTPILSYDDGSVWREYFQDYPLVDDGFPTTWVNQGTATKDTTLGGVFMTAELSASIKVEALVKTAPSTPYTVTVAIMPTVFDADYNEVGICFRESGSGKLHSCQWMNHSGFGGRDVVLTSTWTSATSYNADVASFRLRANGLILFRMGDNGTNRTFEVSFDFGRRWFTLETVGRTSFLTADQVGIFVGANNGTYAPSCWFLSWDQA